MLSVVQVVVVTVAFIALSGCSPLPPSAYEMVDKHAPMTRLTLLEGGDLPLEAFEGKHTALMFWATWCGHSKARMEEFAELAAEYSARRNVAFVAVSVDRADDLDKLRARIQSDGLGKITHMFSGNDVADEAFLAFKGESLPYIIVLDPNGRVESVDISTGPLEDYLEEHFPS